MGRIKGGGVLVKWEMSTRLNYGKLYGRIGGPF